MSARPQSVNDETPVAPRLRKDQRNKIQRLIQAESHPLAALLTVRDYIKNTEFTKVTLDDEVNPTFIGITCTNPESKMATQYQFKLEPPSRLDPPTL